jgi:hypothetical protein
VYTFTDDDKPVGDRRIDGHWFVVMRCQDGKFRTLRNWERGAQ